MKDKIFFRNIYPSWYLRSFGNVILLYCENCCLCSEKERHITQYKKQKNLVSVWDWDRDTRLDWDSQLKTKVIFTHVWYCTSKLKINNGVFYYRNWWGGYSGNFGPDWPWWYVKYNTVINCFSCLKKQYWAYFRTSQIPSLPN